MKRILSALLCLTIIFALIGCGGEKPQNNDQGTNSSTGSPVNSDATSSDNSSTGSNTSSDPSSNTSSDPSSNTSSDPSSNTSSKEEEGPFVLRAAKEITKFDDPNNVVICWGDSITQGMAMTKGYTYPQQLQGRIGSAFRVINAGVPGETSEAILSRANAIEICFTKDVTFAKGEKQFAMNYNMFKVVGEDSAFIYRGFGNELGFSKAIIDGKSYTIEYEKGATYTQSLFHLTRTDASNALTIPAGTKIKYDYSSQYKKNHCNVIYIGANDAKQTTEQLINKYKKLTSQNKNYIVIIPHHSATNPAKEFKAAFGDKAIDLRDYMMNQAHKDYDVELTDTDKYCIENNMVPTSYTYQNQKNDPHLNELGYKILADLVYKKGVELGYWK